MEEMNVAKKEFKDWLITNGVSEKKGSSLYQYLLLFDKMPKDINIKSVTKFLKKHNYPAARSVLKYYLIYTDSDFSINKIPKINRNTKRKLPRYLSHNQVQTILDTIKLMEDKQKQKRWVVLIKLMYEGGLRISEALSVRFEDFDFEGSPCRLKVTNAKGEKERIVFLTDETKEYILGNRKVDKGYLFPSSRIGKFAPISRKTVDRILKEICVKADIMIKQNDNGLTSEVSAHWFRHSCAMSLKKKGWTIQQIQKYLGHSRIETTMIYVQLDPGELADVWNETF